MIVDHIRNRSLYYCLGERYKMTLDYFAQYNPVTLEKQDIALDGSNVFVKVRPMQTKDIIDCSYEAHKLYADIHFVVYGSEKIGYCDVKKLSEVSYNEANDVMFLRGDGDFITLSPGYFMIAFPDDAHMPCVCNIEPASLGKMIAKIKL